MDVHQLSRDEARRIAVRAQLLDAERPTDPLTVIRRLTLLQDDLTAAVAPNPDLVLWSRLGSAYDPGGLAEMRREYEVIELQGLLRPAEDIALYQAEMASWPELNGDTPEYRWAQSEWVKANDSFRRDIMVNLEREGPLTSAELPDTASLPWKSTGWNNDKNVKMMLAMLVERGEVASAGRRGRDRLWDVASRVYPDDDVVPLDEALRIRNERRLRSLGIARSRTLVPPGEPNHVEQAGEPAVVDGVKGVWRVDPEQLGRPFRGRAAVISPLDRLIADRRRMTELFAFDYQLEMFKPAAKRRWGYFALPILYGDRFVGKLDATTDRTARVLRVDAVHRDVPFTKAMAAAVEREIKDLAQWLDVDLDLPV